MQRFILISELLYFKLNVWIRRLSAVDPKQRCIGRELHRLDNCIRRYLCQFSCECKSREEVSGTNMRIIRFLKANEHRDVYQKDVEKEFGITRSTASRVLVLMEEKGLVQRLSVPQDARLKKLILTEKSNHMGEAMRQIGEKTDAQLLKGFSEEEQNQLYAFIDRMAENLSGR